MVIECDGVEEISYYDGLVEGMIASPHGNYFTWLVAREYEHSDANVAYVVVEPTFAFQDIWQRMCNKWKIMSLPQARHELAMSIQNGRAWTLRHYPEKGQRLTLDALTNHALAIESISHPGFDERFESAISAAACEQWLS